MIRTLSASLALAAALVLPAAAQQQTLPQQQPSPRQQPSAQYQPSAQDQQARQAFEQDIKAWEEAYKRKDARALAEMYAPDAVLSEDTTVTGRDAIERWFENEFQRGHLENLALTVDRAQSLGPDHAWAIGTWRGEVSPQMMAMMQRMMQGQGQNMPMQQGQGGGPMMQGQGGPMMQGQGGPMMQGQGQGTSTPPGPGGQRMAREIEGHWIVIAERQGGRSQILAYMSNLAIPAGGCPMCGAAGSTAPQGNR